MIPMAYIEIFILIILTSIPFIILVNMVDIINICRLYNNKHMMIYHRRVLLIMDSVIDEYINSMKYYVHCIEGRNRNSITEICAIDIYFILINKVIESEDEKEMYVKCSNLIMVYKISKKIGGHSKWNSK